MTKSHPFTTEFEEMLGGAKRRAKLKHLSKISLERPLTTNEFKEFKKLGRTEL